MHLGPYIEDKITEVAVTNTQPSPQQGKDPHPHSGLKPRQNTISRQLSTLLIVATKDGPMQDLTKLTKARVDRPCLPTEH